METSDITVIVPVLNELESLAELCNHLDEGGFQQIVLVDGGSKDGSWQWLLGHWHNGQEKLALQSPPGRATQMNLGAASAKGQVLIFLHADSKLPTDAKQQVSKILHGKWQWGRFNLCFDSTRQSMSVVAWFINQRSRLSGIATGDQAIFMRREAFNRIGGFDEIPLMEDIATSQQLKKLSKPLCVNSVVTTSARRWERKGVIRTIVLMWVFRLAYSVGVSPQRLAHYYGHVR